MTIDKKYKNLRGKTIYDLCDDQKILAKLDPLCDEETYRKMVKDDWGGLLDLAEATDNKELEKAVKEEFAKEIRDFFCE